MRKVYRFGIAVNYTTPEGVTYVDYRKLSLRSRSIKSARIRVLDNAIASLPDFRSAEATIVKEY